MYEIFVTATRDGTTKFFMARSWGEARQKASEVAGKRYRYVAIVHESHPWYSEAVAQVDPNSLN